MIVPIIPTSYREKSRAQAEHISKRHADLNFEKNISSAKIIDFPPLITESDGDGGYVIPDNRPRSSFPSAKTFDSNISVRKSISSWSLLDPKGEPTGR